MNYRIFGRTSFNASEVGLGAWQLGADWGEVDQANAKNILHTALDSGVNFFDTADVYGAGRSEKFIGELKKQHKDEIFVATKLGRLKGYPDSYSYELLKECTEDSLKRLQTDSLDLTQLHCIPSKYLKDGEVFDWLRDLKNQGKIKNYGASVESMEEALVCLRQPDIASLQIIFNIYRQKPIHEIFDIAKQKNVALIIRLPLASGLLSGKFNKTSSFPENDHRNYNRDGQAFNVGETFAGIPFEKAVELTEKLKEITPQNISLAQLALRWILDHEAVSVIIPGASKPEQVLSNANASALEPLSEKLHNTLERFYKEEVAMHIRGPY